MQCDGYKLLSLAQEGEQAEHGDSALRLELQQLQARRMLRTLAVVQDLADALLALNDVRGARPELGPMLRGCQQQRRQTCCQPCSMCAQMARAPLPPRRCCAWLTCRSRHLQAWPTTRKDSRS